MKYDNEITLHQRHLTFISFQLCKVEILSVFHSFSFVLWHRKAFPAIHHLSLLVYFDVMPLLSVCVISGSRKINSWWFLFRVIRYALLIYEEKFLLRVQNPLLVDSLVPRERVDGWVNVTWSININVTGWVKRKEWKKNMKGKGWKSYRWSVWETSDKLMLNELMKRFLCSAAR